MIALLRGTVAAVMDDHVVLDCTGVGYAVHAPRSVLSRLTEGSEATLYTVLQMQNEELKLFGFASAGERNLFTTLRSVRGIGGKTALDILGTLPVERFCQAVSTGNLALICTAPGVGKKTAERLVFELRDKVASMPGAPAAMPAGAPGDDAVAGMMYLGYAPGAAAVAVEVARRALGTTVDTESLIREALKHVK